MTFFKAAPLVLGLALVSAPFLPKATADDHDKKTTFTFSQAVEIPAVHLQGWGVLPAGTYVFKLVESSSNRHIVQIFNQDETKVYATIMSIANYRLKPTDKTVLTFNEGLNGRPEALRAWFYPGANWGEEFIYPKAKAIELASLTKLPVLAITAELPLESPEPGQPQVIVQLQAAPIMAVQPTGEVVEIAQVVQIAPEPVVIAQASVPAPAIAETLPATASSLPLLAMLGFLALGVGLSLLIIRRFALHIRS